MKSFAAIYVPYIKRSLFFEESTDKDASMYIENFGATRKLGFKNNPSSTFPKFSFKDTNPTRKFFQIGSGAIPSGRH
jgi:hypothetical protein